MKAQHLLSALVVAGVFAAPQGAGAATLKTYLGAALVTNATAACVAAKWTVGRQFAVNYREAIDASHPRPALRFSDSTFTLVATQRPSTFWTSPTGGVYDGFIDGPDVNAPVQFSGAAKLQNWTSSNVPNARYMPSGEFSNWAKVSGCTLTVRATMIER